MKKTLLAITLAAATVPFTFARAPQQSGSTSSEGQTQPAKKHKKSKKSKKSNKKEGSATTAPQK